MKIRIGSRKSTLALIQTELVVEKIHRIDPSIETEIVTMNTQGDKQQHLSLAKIGGKGVFTKELEEALLRGEIDMAIHSAKDLPLEISAGVEVHSIGEREDPADVLVTKTGSALDIMLKQVSESRKIQKIDIFCMHSQASSAQKKAKEKESTGGFVIGTGSLRRSIQLQELLPGISVKEIRGNVETRLGKLCMEEYDGIILALAGLIRLREKLDPQKLEELSFYRCDPRLFHPAAGQGILAVQSRNGEFAELLQKIMDQDTEEIFRIDREFLLKMAGGCNAPCAIFLDEKRILRTMYFSKNCGLRRESMDLDQDWRKTIEKIVQKLKCGRVSLVGAGPGDAGLLTRKALDCIQKADCIVYDRLISPSILNEAKLDAELIYVGKSAGAHTVSQEEIHLLLIQKARKGKYVVRLKGGDPFIFGRGAEELLALMAEGIACDAISGITSALSVPANAGIPLTHRGISSAVHIYTAQGADKPLSVQEIRGLVHLHGSIVLLMGLQRLGEISKELIAQGMRGDMPTAVISQGFSAMQKTVIGTITDIEERIKEQKLLTPAIIVIGDAVGLSQKLSVEKKNELSGVHILTTGTRSMAKRQEMQLLGKGAQVTNISLIETIEEKSTEFVEAMKNIRTYTWMIFTSSNGVEAFFSYLKKTALEEMQRREDFGIDLHYPRKEAVWDARSIAHLRFAVIGEGSRNALRAHGYVEDFMPSSYSSRTLAGELLPLLGHQDRILLVRASEANVYILEALHGAGIAYTDAPIYRTIMDFRREGELCRLMPKVDYVTIASASAAQAFKQMIGDTTYSAKIVCIGPETARACKRFGLSIDLMAEEFSAEGMCKCIVRDVAKKTFK